MISGYCHRAASKIYNGTCEIAVRDQVTVETDVLNRAGRIDAVIVNMQDKY